MKYFSMFSGIGGFELGIQNAYRGQNRRGQENPSGNEKEGEGLVPEKREETCPAQGSSCQHIDHHQRGCEPSCVGYAEIDRYADAIYQAHFKGHKNYGDARKINTGELENFDLLVGGFPCQAFSIAGKRGGFDDTRGTLFFEIARIAQAKRPRLLLLENVKGLLSHDKGKTFGTILNTLDELGYDIQWQVLNSKDFGVPQNRQRVFIIGHLRERSRPQVFPLRGHNQTDIVVPTLTTRYCEAQANGGYLREITPQGTAQAERIYESEGLAVTISSNGGGMGAKTGLYVVKDPSRKKAAEISNESPTLRSESHGNLPSIVKGSRIRRLTPIECERLQGFPDNWTQYGNEGKKISDAQRYKCLGNAVTVNVIEAVVGRILNE